jgi:hypothetical protein
MVNPQTRATAFNEYFLSLAEKHCVDDDDDDDDGNDDSSKKNNKNNSNIYTPKHYLLKAFNKNLPNIKMKSTST